MLSALLDNLAWIWNYALQLGFRETDSSRNKCVLTHKDFKANVRAKHPHLGALLDEADVMKWLEHLGIKRHPAVHREPLFLIEIVEEGTGVTLSDTAGVHESSDGYRVFDLLKPRPQRQSQAV